MIRPKLLNDVHAALNQGQYFAADDFLMESTAKQDGSGLLKITYRFADTYVFVVEIPNVVVERSSYSEDTVKVSGTVSPGTLTQKERVTYSSKGDFLAGIHSWLERIQEEILAVPAHRELKRQQEQLETLMAQVDDLPDEFFSREEAVELRSRLDELETRLRENILSATENQQEAKSKIAALHADIEQLKQSTEALKKKGWVGSLMVRVKRWSANPENRDLLKSGATVARTLLLGDGTKPPV